MHEKILALYLAKKFHAKKYDSIDSVMENSEVNALSICTPNAMHYDSLKNAIKHEKNILVEKPIVTTLEECNSILKLVKKSDSKVMVGHTHRFYPCNVVLKEIIDKGKIGKPKIINTFDYIPGKNPGQQMPSWMKQKKISGGGVFITDLVHTVDKISWLLNSQVDKVFTPMISDFISHGGVEDAGIAVLWMKDGSVATCVHGCPSPGAVDMSTKVIGTEGEANMVFAGDLNICKNEISSINYRSKGNPSEHNSYAFFQEIDEFVNSVLKDREPKINYKDGILAVKTILALYDSFKKKRIISLD